MLAMICWKVIGVAGVLCSSPVDVVTRDDLAAFITELRDKENTPDVALAVPVRAIDADWILSRFQRVR